MKDYNSIWQLKTWKMVLAASILTAGTAPALLASTVAEAAATKPKPTAYINNVQAQYDVVIRQGITYVALTELQFLGNYTFGYRTKQKRSALAQAAISMSLHLTAKQ